MTLIPDFHIGTEPLYLSRPCPKCKQPCACTAILTSIKSWPGRDLATTRYECNSCLTNITQYTAGQSPTHSKGQRLHLHIKHPRDMTRTLLKSKFATLTFPHLGLQLDRLTCNDNLCTVRELLTFIVSDLEGQVGDGNDLVQFIARVRKILAYTADNIQCSDVDYYVLHDLASKDDPFVLEIDDLYGNSFIEPLSTIDPNLNVTEYEREE